MWQEGLTKNTLEVFEEISKLECIKDLHLCGETGIALQLNHRYSEDLDFELLSTYKSNNSQLNRGAILKELEAVFGRVDSSGLVVTDNHFEFVVGEHVKLSFYRPTLKVPELNEVVVLNNLKTVSLQDALGMKLYVITQRDKFRDYYDIYSLLKNGCSLEKGIEYATGFARHTITSKRIVSKLLLKSAFDPKAKEGRFDFDELNAVYKVDANQIYDYIEHELGEYSRKRQKIDKTAFKSVGRAFYEMFMSAQGDNFYNITASLARYGNATDEDEKVWTAYDILKSQGVETAPYDSLEKEVREIRMRKDIDSLTRIDDIIASYNSYQSLRKELYNLEKEREGLKSLVMDDNMKDNILHRYKENIESAKQKISAIKYVVKFKELDNYSGEMLAGDEKEGHN